MTEGTPPLRGRDAEIAAIRAAIRAAPGAADSAGAAGGDIPAAANVLHAHLGGQPYQGVASLFQDSAPH